MFDALLDAIAGMRDRLDRTPTFEWGVVTDDTPLTVQLEGDASPLPGSPSSLVAGLQINDRVMVLTQNRRVTIIGRGGG